MTEPYIDILEASYDFTPVVIQAISRLDFQYFDLDVTNA